MKFLLIKVNPVYGKERACKTKLITSLLYSEMSEKIRLTIPALENKQPKL